MKKFFKRVVAFLATLFTNPEKFIEEYITPSVTLTQQLRNIVKSPVINFITDLIPGTWDDQLKDRFSDALDKAVAVLSISNECLTKGSPTERLYCFVIHLRSLSPAMRKAVYAKLASEIAKAASGRETVKGHAVDTLTQVQYSKMKESLLIDDEGEDDEPVKETV